MVGIAEASAAIGSIKTALDLVKGVQSFKNETDVNQAIINIQRALLDAQAAALEDRERRMDLLNQIDELNKKLLVADRFEGDRNRYVLTEFPTGRFAYVLKPEAAAAGEPTHRLCAACFDNNRKSVLQVKNKHSGGESVICPQCKHALTLFAFPPAEIRSVRRVRSFNGF